MAIDVGGTLLKGALVERCGRPLIVERRPTSAVDGPEAVSAAVIRFAHDLAARERRPLAVGLAVPGIVVERTGTVVTSTNIGWREEPLRARAEDAPVVVTHDVRAGAIAEGLVGAAQGCRDYLLVTLGTGVGAAVVIGGRPYTGAHGAGGEFGHLAVEPGGPMCVCGGAGCLEAFASAAQLAARYRAIARCPPGADTAEVAALAPGGRGGAGGRGDQDLAGRRRRRGGAGRVDGIGVRLRSERIVTPGGTVAGEIVVADGRIERIGPVSTSSSGVTDLGDRWLVPGFIDLHVHGGGGAQCNTDAADEVATMARFHASHGTTALLATTVAAPVGELEVALRTIVSCVGRAGGAAVLGAHLEGPFLSRERPGAMDPSAFREPDPVVAGRLLDAAGGSVRVMTIAPELPGALELIRSLVRSGVVVSLGHSDATYDQAVAAVEAGARSATHVFNAMRPLHHREPGVLGAALDLAELGCEVICDGIHAAPAAVRLVARAKGLDGVHLVTDAMQAAGMPDGSYRLGGAAVDVRGGRATIRGGGSIAGSTLTMDVAVRNAVRFLGVSVEQAVALASRNPARVLGLSGGKGALAPGFDADIAVLDSELSCCGTVVGGEWVFGSPG